MLEDPTLTGPERRDLLSFIEGTRIQTVVAHGPLLLNATEASKALNVSTDTLKKIRDQAALRGIKELCGVEVTPRTFMFSRVALIRFSQGDFGLDWPGMKANTAPKMRGSPKSQVLDFDQEVTPDGKAAV